MVSPNDVQSRQHDITAKPPRLPAPRTEEVLAPARKIMAEISGAASGSTATLSDEDIPEMILTAMCHKDLFESLVHVSLRLLKEPSLPTRDRQLVILRVGWLRQIPYIWGEHVNVSKKLGLSEEDIKQVTVGSSASCWTDHERTLLKATEELITDGMIDDETWEILANKYSDQQLFELPILVGQFSTVGLFQNALRIRLSPSNKGLMAR